ncbi:hypothetical protein Bca4012_065216 [Brassica carinata]
MCAAVDMHTGEKVAIKKINNVFAHISDAVRVLSEVKLLRHLRHPDIVEIKSIMLPASKREFRDIYVVFELMESDLHQVIKANDDLTKEHHQFFLYQIALKFMHTGLCCNEMVQSAELCGSFFSKALADPYFKGLSKVEREPSCQPISKMEFEFERRRLTKEDIRELIYKEILEYHPQLLKDYMSRSEGSSFIVLFTPSFKTS